MSQLDNRTSTPAVAPAADVVCDSGRTVVDVRGPRFGAAITTVVLGLILLTMPSPVSVALLAWQTLVFGLGAIVGLQAQPYGVLFRRVVRPRIGEATEFEDAAPPRFAQTVGPWVRPRPPRRAAARRHRRRLRRRGVRLRRRVPQRRVRLLSGVRGLPARQARAHARLSHRPRRRPVRHPDPVEGRPPRPSVPRRALLRRPGACSPELHDPSHPARGCREPRRLLPRRHLRRPGVRRAGDCRARRQPLWAAPTSACSTPAASSPPRRPPPRAASSASSRCPARGPCARTPRARRSTTPCSRSAARWSSSSSPSDPQAPGRVPVRVGGGRGARPRPPCPPCATPGRGREGPAAVDDLGTRAV